ncbi:hypothetical protein N7501_012103 [Penicillium viridicatum]|nr:hypothetical protein N7501_012103 [Penicillium viridicatum]
MAVMTSKIVMGGQDEAQKDDDQTKEQTYDDDADDDDAKIEGQNNNNTNDEGEEGQKQDTSPWTVTMHALSPLQVDMRALLEWPGAIPG